MTTIGKTRSDTDKELVSESPLTQAELKAMPRVPFVATLRRRLRLSQPRRLKTDFLAEKKIVSDAELSSTSLAPSATLSSGAQRLQLPLVHGQS